MTVWAANLTGEVSLVANPDLHWDGMNWYRWDGDEWVLDSSIPPPGTEEPEPAPGRRQQQPNQPASEAEPRGNKGKVAALAALGVAVVAAGAAFALTRTGASETDAIAASPSLAEPTDATEAPVTIKPEDMQNAFITSNPTSDYQPAKATRPPTTSVQASDPGVYAGIYQMSNCDRKALSGLLEDSPSRTLWAEAMGKPGKIAAYVDSTTPAVLRWDTYLTRGYVDESTQALTWQPVVLKAGTVVLLNELGIPVVRCASGNPLRPAEGQPVTAKSVTVIPSVAELPGFELRQIINNSITTDAFFRPVGTDGSEDTESSSAPEPPAMTRAPSTSPESSATPAPMAPDSTSTANGVRETDD